VRLEESDVRLPEEADALAASDLHSFHSGYFHYHLYVYLMILEEAALQVVEPDT
jgi:hypothetical protein